MSENKRRRFLRLSDWHNFVQELQQQPSPSVDLYGLRKACYQDIEKLRKRPLLVYAVDFPNSHPAAPIYIDHGDVDGFTDLVEAVEEEESVDVLLHSPGGSPESTERIVALLRAKFTHVTFLIPHSAFSAATMMALSGNEILLHSSAVLGPIDPQVNGTPARSIRRGFDKVRELLKEEGPEALPAYIPLIEKHSLELLEICDDSLKLSQELVSDWLQYYMFEGDSTHADLIEKAVEFFSDYDMHKSHGRPLTFRKLEPLGLEIALAPAPLKELLREAHILLNGFFHLTSFVKLYENGSGLSWGRQFQVMPLGTPAPQAPQS